MQNDRLDFATSSASASPSLGPRVKEEDDNDNHGKSMQKQTARRRAYAKRSCLKCREKKARCELPDLSIPSSMQAVSVEKACHRCKVLSLDCVVYDGDRKRKPKIATSSAPVSFDGAKTSSSFSSIPLKRKSQQETSPSARSPGSLEQLAAAAAHLSDQRQGFDGSSDVYSRGDTSTVASGSRGRVSMLASVQFFNPAVEEMSTPSSAFSPPRSQQYPHSAGASLHADASQSSGARRSTPKERSHATTGRQNKRIQPPGKTWTSLWRPLSVLIDYAAQQPSFTTYLILRVDTALPSNIDVTDLISNKMCLHLKPFIRPYVLWHPHLPALEWLYEEHRTKPTTSSALLLTSMCLVACRHAMPLTDELPRKLSALIDQLGTHILLSAPRDMYTVQALELLLAHEPSLVGTQIAGSGQAERGNGLLGESLLAAALTIAKGLDLDKCFDTIANILASSPPSDAEGTHRRRRVLGKAMAGASIWISLQIWEGHFSFVNSTLRPIDLKCVVDHARALIAIDNDGMKIERRERDPFVLIEQNFPGLDEDSVLRSAGRTGLVYRLMTMARFQGAVADLYRVLAVAPKPESRAQVPTSFETRTDILASLAMVSKQRDIWEYCKMQDFAVYSSVRPALLLESWATVESFSLQSLLPCLAICAFTTGELNRGFSAIDLIGYLRQDEAFRKHSADLGVIRDAETNKLLSAFYLFDRGLGYSKPDLLGRMSRLSDPHSPLLIEATGAPLLLTTAFATDGCKTFLEKTACSLAGFSHLPDTTNMHIGMMLQTLQRLAECDQNRYQVQPSRSRMHLSPMSPHDRRSRLKRDTSHAHEEGIAEPGKSISQIGMVFVEEMFQAMSKWKLGVSLHRQEEFKYRIPPLNSGSSSSSTPQSLNSAPSHYGGAAVGRGEQTSKSGLAAREPVRNGVLAPPTSDATRGGNQWNAPHGENLSFLAQQQQETTRGHTLVDRGNAQGGMFDIPMFDGLFNPTFDQWANSVPWFDPVNEANSDMGPGMGSSMLRPPSMEGASVMHRSSQTPHWSSAVPTNYYPPATGVQPRMGHNTLPPLLSVTTPASGQQQYGPVPPYGQGYGTAPQQPYYPAQPPASATLSDHHHHHHHFYGHVQRPS